MKEEITDPIGYPDMCRFQLIDMFSACTTEDIKKLIIHLYTMETIFPAEMSKFYEIFSKNTLKNIWNNSRIQGKSMKSKFVLKNL